MLPRKRAAGAEVEDAGEALLKKAKADGGSISSSSPPLSSSAAASAGKENHSSLNGMDGEANGRSPMEIDEDLHSRQLAVYGRETMRRLFASNVLISGLQGLGAEIAKNLVLAGIKSVTLHDEGIVELWDLSSNFFLSEDDVGKNRALACVQKLQELNNAVTISTLTGALAKEQLSVFQAVVFTDISLEKAMEYNDYCHNHQPAISFIKSEVRGLFGGVFCDFGPKFTVIDVDGEEPHTGIIASVSNSNSALVSCVDDERLEFEDGDLVVFSEVLGMTQLNDGKSRKIKSTRPYSFILEEDTTKFGEYEKGGIVTQVKQPKVLQFKPLRVALRDPGDFLLSDFSKFDRPPLLHLAFQALDMFRRDEGRFPVAGSEEDVQKLIAAAISFNESMGDDKLEEIDKSLLRHFANGSKAILNPMAAMFGGIVGQEVVKACSGKFHPLFQFFYFDSVESLPTEPLEPGDLKPLNCRYDAQISVFGSKLQKKLEEAKVFMVGSGALGCEFLKNLALMGVCCSQQGKLTITDDDVIEKSNLSRQFLFRDWNIGQSKSTVAATVAGSINSSLHIEVLQNRASPETEHVFNDAFWERLNVVMNALDNVTARMYMDQRCLYFQKPLLESGTLGAKCNTQMVIPHLSENYGASRDPPEKQAPMCTVHSFPHNIDHCLTWARSEFDGLLEKTPNEVNTFLSNPSEYASSMRIAGDAQARDLLEHVIECLDKDRCETFQDCVSWARLRFEDYFSNRVKQLTFTFPEDSATSTGALFWSAPKRFPRPLQFSASDPTHLHFIMAASILRAETFGILIPDWANNPKKLADAVRKVLVPDFQPKKGVKIVTDEKATSLSAASVDDAAVINDLIAMLEGCAKKLPPGFRMNPIQFEKDDDTNYHMDLIAGLANMRARNYSIPEVDKLKAKFIAGRIIPAIATSTAMATGLVCLELYKVLDGGHKVEDYRNTFANLALPLFSMAEPVPPKVFKHRDMSWTVWDRWIVKGNLTLRELLQWLKDRGLEAYSISCGASLLYNSMFPRHRDRMAKKVADLAKEVAKLEVPPYRNHLDVVVACEDEEGLVGKVDFSVRHLSSSATAFPSTLPDFSSSPPCIDESNHQCSAYTASASSETTWTMRTTFPEYIVALATIVGSVLFSIFGGVGIAALPLGLIFSFIRRPKAVITRSQYIKEATELAKKARELKKAAEALRQEEKSGSKGRKWRKNVKAVEKELLLLEDDMKALEEMYPQGEQAEAACSVTVLAYMAKLILGVIGLVVSVAWVAHIIIYLLVDPPLSPFLNEVFIKLDDIWGLLGTVAFAFFCFYLLLAVIAGSMMLGLNLVFITIHPMKWGGTLMNSFLFNVGLILLCSISVIQFCATAFAYYAQATAAQEIFGHTLQSLRGIKYLYKYNVFQYAFVVLAVVTLFFYLAVGRKKRRPSGRFQLSN